MFYYISGSSYTICWVNADPLASPFCRWQTLHLCLCENIAFWAECLQLSQSQFILTSTSLRVEPPPAWWTYAPRWSALYLFRRLVGVSRLMGIAPPPCSTSRWNCRRWACTSLKLPLCWSVCVHVGVCVCMCVWKCISTCHILCKHENQGSMTVKEVSNTLFFLRGWGLGIRQQHET